MAETAHIARHRRQGESTLGALAGALVVSLGGHAAAVLLLFVFALVGATFWPSAPRRGPTEVGLVALRSSVWAENRAARREPRDPARPTSLPEERRTRSPADEKPPGKIVDVAPNGVAPDDARFVSSGNNRVEKETRAESATLFYENAMPRRTTTVPREERQGGKDDVARAVVAGNAGLGDDDRPFKPRQVKSRFEIPDVKARARVALKLDAKGTLHNREESDAIRGNSGRLVIQPGREGGADAVDPQASMGKRGDRDLVTLVPSDAVLDKVTGAPAADLTPLDDVERGDATFLNTREWKHAGFFNRVKQNVGMSWDPGTALRRRDPTGQIYAYRDRYTILSVVLDPNGSLRDVFVEKSCGADFLDEEAIAAFQRAQPFPNPPLALVDPKRDEIRFSFGFYLEVSSRPALRLFRQGY